MKATTAKTKPLPAGPISAETWKKEMRFRAETLADVIGVRASGEPVTATVKVDGELVVFDVDVPAGVVTLHNRNEVQLHVLPIQRELLAAAKAAGRQRVRGVAELYAVDQDGRSLPRGEVIGLIRKRAKATTPAADQHAMRLAPFDLTEQDGTLLFRAVPYAERFALLYALFGGGTRVRPVIGQTNIREASPIQALWNKHVLEENFEGLVIRSNGAVKVKPIHTLDLVVIAVQPGAGRLRDTVGALVLAFRDWTGRFLEAGKVGTGLTDADRTWWQNHVQRVPGKFGKGAVGARTPFVAPVHVVEVEVESFNRRLVRGWRWDATRQRYDADGQHPGAMIIQARYVGRREDKHPTPEDLRLEQVPGWTVAHAQVVIPAPEFGDARFRDLLVEFRPDLERFASKLRIRAEDREDVIQSTFAKALEAWRKRTPTPGAPIAAWLFQILKYAWFDVARKQAGHRAKLAELERRGIAMRERSAVRVEHATRANPRRRTAAAAIAARRTA
jgi:hypothetical protein